MAPEWPPPYRLPKEEYVEASVAHSVCFLSPTKTQAFAVCFKLEWLEFNS